MYDINSTRDSLIRFGRGFYNFRVLRDLNWQTREKLCANVCPHCHRTSPSGQCIDTHYSCVGCQGWW